MTTSRRHLISSPAKTRIGHEGLADEDVIKNTVEPNLSRRGSMTYESRDDSEKSRDRLSRHSNWGKWSQKATRLLILITLLAAVTRYYRIGHPSRVVFDEVHFGGFASNYLRREYYFDVHPPLGKMLIAGIGYLCGFDGSYNFPKVDDDYMVTSTPYVAMRTAMATLGTISIGLAYAIMIELGLNPMVAATSATLLVFDGALITQTRYILLDSFLFVGIFASIFGWIKFRQLRYQPFSTDWWASLMATGVALGLAIGTKMVGLFTMASVGVATIIDLWQLSAWQRHLSSRVLVKHIAARAIGLIVIPSAIYVAAFYVHFAILTQTGSGDKFMSPAFQAALIGNTMHADSRQVFYGQEIRIKNKEEDIFLHSHEHLIPLRHNDGIKISSNGQQVTGHRVEDDNNVWKILPADPPAPLSAFKDVTSLRTPIKHNDKFRLYHVRTNKYMMSHDVASALTMTNEEITAVAPDNLEKYNNTLWQLEIRTPNSGGLLRSKAIEFRLIHVATRVYLTNQRQDLPEWGFGHREVNGDKRGITDASKWVIHAVLDPMIPEEVADREARLAQTPKLSFWQKFTELQLKMLESNSNLIDEHPFKSSPIQWPLVLRGISFWDHKKEARVYLLGNIVSWYAALVSLLAFCGMTIRELYSEHRRMQMTVSEKFKKQMINRGGFVVMCYLLHYVPFYTMHRSLYLHHYLPAYMFSNMAVAMILDYSLHRRQTHLVTYAVMGLLLYATVSVFWFFTPITYGLEVPSDVLATKRWISTWDWP